MEKSIDYEKTQNEGLARLNELVLANQTPNIIKYMEYVKDFCLGYIVINLDWDKFLKRLNPDNLESELQWLAYFLHTHDED